MKNSNTWCKDCTHREVRGREGKAYSHCLKHDKRVTPYTDACDKAKRKER
jgi:hypothetical protein